MRRLPARLFRHWALLHPPGYLLLVEVAGTLFKSLIFGFYSFPQFLQNLDKRQKGLYGYGQVS